MSEDPDTLYAYRRRIEEEEARLRASVEEHLIRKGRLERAQAMLHGTTRLNPDGVVMAPVDAGPAASTFRVMPPRFADQAERLGARWWRIELHPADKTKSIMGLDIVEDVIIGRAGDPSAQVDLDMEPYEASRHGVSRQHALIRPTPNHLYITDLGSTNGTRFNGERLMGEAIYALKHNDVISFGNLVFQVRILRAPQPE